MEKINKWLPLVNTIAIVALFVMVLVGGKSTSFGETNFGTRFPNGLAVGPGQNVTASGEFFAATSSVLQSYDGYVATKTLTIATGTAAATYTATATTTCYANVADVHFYPMTSALSPSLVFSLGTTSATGVYSTNLLASTTAATGTDQVFGLTYTKPFVLYTGQKVQLGLSDYMAPASASSTYYKSGWKATLNLPCSLTGSNE